MPFCSAIHVYTAFAVIVRIIISTLWNKIIQVLHFQNETTNLNRRFAFFILKCSTFTETENPVVQSEISPSSLSHLALE